jgi:vacuolar protein sorting-associated protein 26
MAAFFFSSPIDIDIKLEGEDLRKQVDSKAEKDRPISCPIYFDGESVSGQVRRFLRPSSLPAISTVLRARTQVTVRVREGKRTTHEGIKVEFVGNIGAYTFRRAAFFLPAESAIITELFYDRGHHHEFLSLSQELAAPGEMRQAQTFDFLFKNIEKQYESYQGINVKLRSALFCIPLSGVSDART